MTKDKIKIYLADDHKILRESLIILLGQEEDIEVVGEAQDGIVVEEQVPAREVDLLILDISMPKRSGLDVAKNLLRMLPNLKIIFLTMHKSEEILAEAFESGAKGYVLKENAFEELIQAIHTVMAGNIYVSSVLSPTLLHGFLSNERRGKDLSVREREILKLLAEGYSNKEISDILVISIKTVETHRANIMRKNNFKNITELVLYAARNHLIEI
ncbi:response regulator [Sinanaerobacter chloroacetimidivorans]|jgi:DNA-binding NarL/FixJ family response regulator|uniref:Stage 0 sporulation protein A homolog n=1 Tax=Sinanaerobacter chloroacetimidivorans TaxID=2818044 RepID=A0A8J8B2N1_9FIRM|nr:response regulator transcription factor [Sinanaerobacter chloroacetimidivorans]MBR0599484.1 response regulator transcription factor [Sinanaerobacter chloroacetimidivorans]